MTITISFSQSVWAGETAFNRISSTFSGGSGLFITQSINTLAPGKLETGLGLSYLDGRRGNSDLKITKLSSTMTFGLTPNMEVSAQIPYFVNLEIGNTSDSAVGDINLALKWRIQEPSTDFNFPGFAFHLTAFLPTGGDRAKGTAQVDSWGLKLLLVSSAEAEIGTPEMHILVGFYADGGVYLQDSGDPTEENSGIIDLGMLIPLDEAKTLQLILEANSRVNREFPLERQYVAVTGGLRYVTRHLTFNGGWQHRVSQAPVDDSNQLIFYGSYFF